MHIFVFINYFKTIWTTMNMKYREYDILSYSYSTLLLVCYKHAVMWHTARLHCYPQLCNRYMWRPRTNTEIHMDHMDQLLKWYHGHKKYIIHIWSLFYYCVKTNLNRYTFSETNSSPISLILGRSWHCSRFIIIGARSRPVATCGSSIKAWTAFVC